MQTDSANKKLKGRTQQLLNIWRDAGLLPSQEFLRSECSIAGDADYWRWADQRILLRALRSEVGSYAAGSDRISLLLTTDSSEPLPEIARVREAVSEEYSVFSEAFKALCKKAGLESNPPRLLRLADQLELSQLELDILHIVIGSVCNSRIAALRNMRGAPSIDELATVLDLNADCLFGCLSSEAPLIASELLRVEKDILGSFRGADILMDLPAVKALRGLELSDQDLYVLGGSVLGDLLATEGLEVHDAMAESEEDELDSSDQRSDAEGELTHSEEIESVVEELCGDEAQTDVPEMASNKVADQLGSDGPYKGNAEYLEDYMELFRARYEWKKLQFDGPKGSSMIGEKRSFSSMLREAESSVRIVHSTIRDRLHQTRVRGSFKPRGEQVKEKWELDEFEKHVLLLAACRAASVQFREDLDSSYNLSAGNLIALFFDSLEDQVAARRYFYRNATLIENGLLNFEDRGLSPNILDLEVDIDQRLTDYLLGIDAESGALIEGSHLYTPNVAIDRVVLPENLKNRIVEVVRGFPAFVQERKRCGLDDLLDYGRGLVLLFYGASGTGKTMMANALGTLIGKRILLVNFPTIGTMASDEVLRLLFREAELNDAVLFFDECDGIFENREQNPGLSLILSELERYEGLVIMATNRPYELDDAMRRRITMPVEFPPPDPRQRAEIWRAHVPKDVRLSDSPDFDALAHRYELTGGLIKNSVLSALSSASSRDPETPVITPEDLEVAAREQMTARLQMSQGRDRIVPRHGLDRLIVPDSVRERMEDLIKLQKSKRTLTSRWGFSEDSAGLGATALLHGPPGTGKTLAAMAVAFELGRAVKRVNLAQIISKWVGEGAKNIDALFDEAEHSDAILLFDEADALFAGRSPVGSATDRYANLEVAVLLQRLEEFSGVAILTTNLFENVDTAFLRRIRFVMEFPRPDKADRRRLWRLHVPEAAPLSGDVDFDSLAAAHRLTGGQIRNAVFKAAARAASRNEERMINHCDLEMSATEEAASDKSARGIGFMPV